jgi:hypothetical protein
MKGIPRGILCKARACPCADLVRTFPETEKTKQRKREEGKER